MSTAAVVKKCVGWLDTNFRANISKTFNKTPFELKHIYAIAFKESSELWPNLIGKYDADEILSFCVLDGSGDVSGTKRSPFPKNRAAFEGKYGSTFTEMLIAEGNKARKVRGLSPTKTILYKAYGIFQYDLQYVVNDRAFFEKKQWYNLDDCLARLKKELLSKYASTHDVRKAIKAYNGSGARAEDYVNDVFEFIHSMDELGLP
ncbi:MAG: hypothetical protein ACAI37_04550 [Chthoniobacter sp.]